MKTFWESIEVSRKAGASEDQAERVIGLLFGSLKPLPFQKGFFLHTFDLRSALVLFKKRRGSLRVWVLQVKHRYAQQFASAPWTSLVGNLGASQIQALEAKNTNLRQRQDNIIVDGSRLV